MNSNQHRSYGVFGLTLLSSALWGLGGCTTSLFKDESIASTWTPITVEGFVARKPGKAPLSVKNLTGNNDFDPEAMLGIYFVDRSLATTHWRAALPFMMGIPITEVIDGSPNRISETNGTEWYHFEFDPIVLPDLAWQPAAGGGYEAELIVRKVEPLLIGGRPDWGFAPDIDSVTMFYPDGQGVLCAGDVAMSAPDVNTMLVDSITECEGRSTLRLGADSNAPVLPTIPLERAP